MADKNTFEDVRTTVVLPYAIDRNLQVLSLTTDRTRNELIKEALAEFLTSRGLNPSALPRIQVSY